jgi:hypothetical protein
MSWFVLSASFQVGGNWLLIYRFVITHSNIVTKYITLEPCNGNFHVTIAQIRAHNNSATADIILQTGVFLIIQNSISLPEKYRITIAIRGFTNKAFYLDLARAHIW